MWEYIKANNLQNPENKREILSDEKLQAVFAGKSKVSMFEMNRVPSPSVSPRDHACSDTARPSTALTAR